MKGFNIFTVFLFGMILLNAQEAQQGISSYSGADNFGRLMNTSGVLSSAEMTQKYESLQVADTLHSKFKAIVEEVCQAKGCWMKLQLQNGEKAMVKFEDYGFFMPKDIVGREVIVNGSAFVEEMSIADQQHYAKDAGKSEEEIAAITSLKKTYGFEADGVLVLK